MNDLVEIETCLNWTTHPLQKHDAPVFATPALLRRAMVMLDSWRCHPVSELAAVHWAAAVRSEPDSDTGIQVARVEVRSAVQRRRILGWPSHWHMTSLEVIQISRSGGRLQQPADA
jgi:hypothetical protein